MTHRLVSRLAALAVTATAALALVQSPAASAQEKHLQFSINLGHHGHGYYVAPPPPPPVVVYHQHHHHSYYQPPAIVYGYSNYGSFGYAQPGHGGGHWHGDAFCRRDHGAHGKQKIKYKHHDRGHGRDD